MAIKICIGTKEGKTLQKELAEDKAPVLVGKKIGDKVSGNDIEFEGYEFEITGGSDSAGKPMRKDIEGSQKKKILCVEGTGVHKQRDGQKQRKLVAGNVVSEKTSQVNLKVIKAGKASLFEEPKAEEEADAEAPVEEKKEE